MTVKRGSEEFQGYNKPKRTPGHPTKSHAVLAELIKSILEGAALEPGLFIFSPEPAAIRLRLAWMFA